nr:TlpA disulfide reductase family protein [uncultured Chitinophaga sp.]
MMTKIVLVYRMVLLLVLFPLPFYGQERSHVIIQGYIKPSPGTKASCLVLTMVNDTFRLSVDSAGFFSRIMNGTFDFARPLSVCLEYQENNAVTPAIKRHFVLDTPLITLRLDPASGEIAVKGGKENRLQDLFRDITLQYPENIRVKDLMFYTADSINTAGYLKELSLIKEHNSAYVAFQRIKSLLRPSAYTVSDSILAAIKKLDTLRFSRAERDDILRRFSDYVAVNQALLNEHLFPALEFETMAGTMAFDKLASLYPYLLIDVWATWCGPCIRQHPFLDKLAMENSHDKSFAIAGLAISSRKADWEKYLKEKPSGYQQYWLDEKQGEKLAGKLKLIGIPRYLLIRTADKIIVEKDIDFANLEKTIRQYTLDRR